LLKSRFSRILCMVEGRAMAKNIVILLDGTSNQISGDRTNVLRLYGSLERSRSQLVFYQPGVGTFGLIGWWRQLRSNIRIIMGLATGAGISDNVMQAYEFLVENWEFGDRIYVLAFSRGAYTARLLTGFIRIFGLVRREQLHLLRFAWRAYTRLGQPGSEGFLRRDRPFPEGAGWPWRSHRVSRPLGHGGLGVRFEVRFSMAHHHPESLHQSEQPGEDRPPCRRHRRTPDLFPAVIVGTRDRTTRNGRKKAPLSEKPQDFEEVWFTGCHCDVGGGYPDDKKSGLAKIPLEWLYREAEAAGVAGDEEVFDLLTHGKDDAPVITGEARDEAEKDTKRYGAPDPLADINNSMNFAWGFVEFLPRKVPRTSFYRQLQARQGLFPGVRLPPKFRRAPSCTKR
jgi:hypothetical protein